MADWQRIIFYMRTHKGLTCKECEREIGTTELRTRISELRKRGYIFTHEWVEGVNRAGHPTRNKRYFLLQEGRASE